MTRAWNELVARLAEVTPGGIAGVVIALLLIATVVAVLWYTWPPSLPFLGGAGSGSRGAGSGRRRWHWARWRLRWRWPRWLLRWPRWLRRRKRDTAPPAPEELAPDELPDLPAQVLVLTADQLAAAGRYAEAVRERLRAIVRELIEREVIDHRPGWTVTELATTCGRARPDTAVPLRGAADLFSEIWYGQRPATVDDDARMREYAGRVAAALEHAPKGVPT